MTYPPDFDPGPPKWAVYAFLALLAGVLGIWLYTALRKPTPPVAHPRQ